MIPADSEAGFQPQPTPQHKKKMWVAAVVAVVAVVAVAIAAISMFRPAPTPVSPRQHISQAINNTVSGLLAERIRQTALSDMAALLAGAFGEPTQHSFSLRLKGLLSFGDIGFRVNTQSDPAGRQAEADFSVTMSGFPLGGVSSYLRDDVLSFAAPLLFKGEYGINLETIGRDFSASALNRIAGELWPDDMALQVWPSETMIIEAPPWLSEANKRFVDEAGIEERGSQNVPINDFPRDCEIYEIIAGMESVRRYIHAIWDGLKSEQALFAGISASMPGYTPEQIISRADAYLDALANSLTGDLSISVFIHDGRLVRAIFRLPFSVYGPDAIIISIQIGGEQNLSDALTIEASSNETGFLMKWAGRHVPTDGKYDTALMLYRYNGLGNDAPLIFALNGWYDSNLSEDNCELTLALTPEFGDSIMIRLNGALRYDKAAKTLTADISQGLYSAKGDAKEFTAVFERKPSSNKVFSARTPTMLFTLSEDELQRLVDEFQANIGGISKLF
jgi:hypothetical protein